MLWGVIKSGGWSPVKPELQRKTTHKISSKGGSTAPIASQQSRPHEGAAVAARVAGPKSP